MAAVCNLRYGEEIDAHVCEEEGEHFILFQIGHEAASPVEYWCKVVLSPLPGYAPDGYELVFYVLETDLANDHVVYRRDGSETRRCFPDREDRQLILLFLCAAVRRLIQAVQPHVVQMCTYCAHLPEVALRKYHLVASVFGEEGYEAGRSDPYYGLHIWMMQRKDT